MTASATPQAETQTRGRVLVVEDDAHIRDLVVLHLQLEGLTPVAAGDGTTGLKLAKADPFDLLILDLMLPGIDGVTLCRAVRRESMNGDVPILMLTARREEADKVLGLESGADDYLTNRSASASSSRGYVRCFGAGLHAPRHAAAIVAGTMRWIPRGATRGSRIAKSS